MTISAAKAFSKKNLIIIAISLLALALAFTALKWFSSWRYIISTDDAYVQGDIASLSPRVSGYIDGISVASNSPVKKGDILFHIEDKDYQLALAQAEAKLATQNHSISRIDEEITAKQINLDQAKAQKDAALAVKNNAAAALQRTKKLNTSRYATQAQLDNAQSSLDQATANLASAESQINAASAAIKILQAQKLEMQSATRSLEIAYQKAKRDLDSCTIYAPFDGIIANISAKQGDLVGSGQRLASLVPVNKLYIEANVKETQLTNIKIGQKVYFTLDSLKKQNFEGRVLSIAPATGGVFSLLPPQNATGNFTKIVQRVPVRISIPQAALNSGQIRAGLSAVVEIDTRDSSSKAAN